MGSTSSTPTTPATKIAYSYVRLSSSRQIKGSGAERQLAKFAEICMANGWIPSEKTFSDMGVSAFSGTNRLKGDLANFIDLAKTNKLGEHPTLVLEQYDRFSRQDIDESEPAILDLLKCGVDIHVAFSNKTFTRESTKDIGSRIEILLSLKQAHEYSANLSKRIKASNVSLRKRFSAGQIIKHRNTPLYYSYDPTQKQYVQNKEKAKIAKRIIEEYLKGKTLYAVARTLNDEAIPRIGYSKTALWEVMNVKNILRNPAIYGALSQPIYNEKQIEVGKRILNASFYSEPLTDKATFDKIQLMLTSGKKHLGRHSAFTNLFRGLAKCPYCKGAISMNSDYINRRTGKPHPTPYRYFRCTGVTNGTKCENRHAMNLKDVEDEFFFSFLQQDPQNAFKSSTPDNAAEIASVDAELAKVSKKIVNLLSLGMDDMEEVQQVVEPLKQEKELLLAKKQELAMKNVETTVNEEMAINFKKFWDEAEIDFITPEEFHEDISRLHKKLQDPELRLKLRLMIPSIVSKIHFDSINKELEIFDLAGKSIYTTFAHSSPANPPSTPLV